MNLDFDLKELQSGSYLTSNSNLGIQHRERTFLFLSRADPSSKNETVRKNEEADWSNGLVILGLHSAHLTRPDGLKFGSHSGPLQPVFTSPHPP